MKLRSLLSILSLVVALPLLSVSTVNAQAPQATFQISNSVNTAETFTIDGHAYSVPANGGQLAFEVTPGNHQYTGAIAGYPGISGSINLPAGQTFSIAADIGQFEQVFDAKGNVIDQSTYLSTLVFVELMWGPGGTKLPVQDPPAGDGALVLDNNMASDVPLILRHDFQTTLPANGRLEFILNPTQVRYTASGALSSWESTNNGVAQLQAGQVTALALNANYNVSVKMSAAEKDRVKARNATPWELEVSPVPNLR